MRSLMIVEASYLIDGNTFLSFYLMEHCVQQTIDTCAPDSITVKEQKQKTLIVYIERFK